MNTGKYDSDAVPFAAFTIDGSSSPIVNEELTALESLRLLFRPSLKAKKRLDSPRWENMLSRTVAPTVGWIADAGENERPRMPEFPVVLRNRSFVSSANAKGLRENRSEPVE